MQLARLPAQADLAEAYSAAESLDYIGQELGQRRTAGRLLDRIDRHVRTGAVFDVGCWVGLLLDEARRRGWRAVGLEPSRFASEFARGELGLEVQTADLFSCELEPSSFDAVVLADVLEHLPDPGEALDRIAELVRPGGVLLLTLPDAGSRLARLMGARWWSVIPTHVHYFTRHSLGKLLGGMGWELLEIDTAPKAFTVRYYMGRLEGYSARLSSLAIRATEVCSIADRVWAPDFGDRMCAIARVPVTTTPRLPGGAPRTTPHRFQGCDAPRRSQS